LLTYGQSGKQLPAHPFSQSPLKALIISNRANEWQERIPCYQLLMPFLSGIIVVAPPTIIQKCAPLTDKYIRFIDEREFINPEKPEIYGLDGFEHASFNFILRTSIICSDMGSGLLGKDFLVMDDDNIPLEKISREVFFSNNQYIGYFYQRFPHILPKKFQFRSYDISLRKTHKMLKDMGINKGFIFSSHMPQIINRSLFIEACNFFNPAEYGYMICDWSMYFNYTGKYHPQQFRIQPAPVICWPMNARMAAGSLFNKKRLFENYYEDNYKEGGIFHNFPRFASPDNDGLLHNQKKIVSFLKYYPSRKGLGIWVSLLTLKIMNALLPEKIIKILYLLAREEGNQPKRLKRTAVYWKSVHSRSYIPAMKSRRWVHEENDVQVIGLFDYPSGLGTSANYLADTMEKIGGRNVKRINVSGYFRYPGAHTHAKNKITSTKGGTAVFMLGPPQACRILHQQDFSHLQHKKLVNYVWFETNTIPDDWEPSLTYFDEIWVHNDYIRNLLAPICTKLEIPLNIRPFIPAFAEPDDMTGIFAPDKISILTVFNINSGWYRKNPLALINAWSMLPPQIAGHSELIIKTNSVPGHRHYKKLIALAQQYNFTVLNTRYSDQEISGLIQGCDIYASLHRAEGLALLPLQAMSYGKAVLATGWSGNMSYMTEQANILVDHILHENNRELRPHIPDMVISDKLIFTEQVEYAEADIQHASLLLEKLIMDNSLRTRTGQEAQRKYHRYIASIHAIST
jgi:hypothetical protein